MAQPFSCGFLGAGKLATALAKGWLNAGLIAPENALASDPLPEARHAFEEQTNLHATHDNRQVVEQSDLLVLAVKPQSMATLLKGIQDVVSDRHLIVSVAAGITIKQIEHALGKPRRLVRVMPNTPCLVGASASAFAPSESATEQDIALVDRLFNAVGRAFRVPENLLDAVTGLSGSGPAFVYAVIEALSDGGVRVGLPRDIATVLAAQTVFGSAKMVLETSLHPGQLKDMVTSPGGTTIAGLHAMEKGGLRAALIDAVVAATNRARELRQPKS
ncbi:MAG: pyrroline-5-carboxylate reductase [Gemmatales bacterium]|nr:MAG: pyrroline-5-carboxylate reductase [Gemmatales bacterium]